MDCEELSMRDTIRLRGFVLKLGTRPMKDMWSQGLLQAA